MSLGPGLRVGARGGQAPPTGNPSSGLTSFWKFSNNLDAIGSNNLSAAGSPSYVSGLVGNAVQLVAASSQYLSRSDALTTGMDPGTSDFALSIWHKPTTLPGAGAFWRIFTKGATNDTTPGYDVRIYDAGYVRVMFGDGTAARVAPQTPNGSIASGSWHHIAVNFDRDGSLSVYINGVLQTLTGSAVISSQAGNVDNGSSLYFGLLSTVYCNGLLDMAGFWNSRLLTAADIAALYNSGSGWEPS